VLPNSCPEKNCVPQVPLAISVIADWGLAYCLFFFFGIIGFFWGLWDLFWEFFYNLWYFLGEG